MYKLGWFSTGRGQGSRNLLTSIQESIKSGEIKAEIEFVFCSREPGEAKGSDIFIKLVRDYSLPLVCFSYQKFRKSRGSPAADPHALPDWRLDYDREVMARLKDFQPDLCVLAGYMLVVGNEMCRKYHMINLHPAAPGGPVGTWQEVIWQLIENGTDASGVMMHLVVQELDMGPPVTCATFTIRGKDFDQYWSESAGMTVEQLRVSQGEENRLFKQIRLNGATRELPLVVATVKAFSEGKVRITPDQRVVDNKSQIIKGYDLTREINRQLKLP
jgi:folate-dependent phosphoribosylglycinamide formyltransferase PurN